MRLPGEVGSDVLCARKAALKKRKSMNFTVTESPAQSHKQKPGQDTVQVVGMRVGSVRSPKFKVASKKDKRKFTERKEEGKKSKKLAKKPVEKKAVVKKDVDLFFNEQDDTPDMPGTGS